MVEKTKGCFIKRPDGSDLFLGPFDIEVWNLAIEAAAMKADEAGYEPIAEVIRDLKK